MPGICRKCGARRIDAQLGSEPLHDCGAWMPVEHFTGEYREEWVEDEDEDADGNRVFFKVKRLVPVIEYSQREPCGECYICHMRQVARECWRVLRDDGVMFWNIGDSYASTTKGNGDRYERDENFRASKSATNKGGSGYKINVELVGLKPKDRCGIPERTALAFQADGWYWRSGITWVKPNPMPESVTDRPTKSTEMIYLFTKSERYFWDAEAVREDAAAWNEAGFRNGINDEYTTGGKPGVSEPRAGRNLRDAWTIATQSYPGAHYATFPSELPRRCIKAGTSERGCCPKCGKGWVRVVSERNIPYDDTRVPGSHKPTSATKLSGPKMQAWLDANPIATLGWRPACACDAGDPVPCIVLDPFSGAATTGLVARELGRHYIGLELSGEYLQQSRDRLGLTALDAWAGGNGRKHEPASITDLPLFGGQHES